MIIGNEPFDKTILPPDNFRGISSFSIKRKGSKPILVKLFGERHTGDDKLGADRARKVKVDTIKYLHNELMSEPNSVLYIEANPNIANEEGDYQSVLNFVANRLSKLHPTRVGLMDRRKEKYLHQKIPPHYKYKDSTPDDKMIALHHIREDASQHYEKYPNFEQVVRQHADMSRLKDAPHMFNSPLLDSQILTEINRATKEGYNPFFYVGDAHRKNISKALQGVEGIEGSGLEFKSTHNDTFRTHLKGLKVEDLKGIIRGINKKTRIVYSKMRKQELIEAIIQHADLVDKKIYTKAYRISKTVKPKKQKTSSYV